ncbi:hypothetical protein V2I01_32385 [Micromonospora sp. BRA006-A]|nr:hypothetical protein [Micromonospora sp. BRA006-A]
MDELATSPLPEGDVLTVLPAVDVPKNDDGSEWTAEQKQEWFQQAWAGPLRDAAGGGTTTSSRSSRSCGTSSPAGPQHHRDGQGGTRRDLDRGTGLPPPAARRSAARPGRHHRHRHSRADDLATVVDDDATDVVLVYYGDTPDTPPHQKVVDRLAAAARPGRTTVVLVLGNDKRDLATSNAGVHVAALPHVTPEQMAGLRNRATLVVTEGANTWQEALTAGKPTLSVTGTAGDTRPWDHRPRRSGTTPPGAATTCS